MVVVMEVWRWLWRFVVVVEVEVMKKVVEKIVMDEDELVRVEKVVEEISQGGDGGGESQLGWWKVVRREGKLRENKYEF